MFCKAFYDDDIQPEIQVFPPPPPPPRAKTLPIQSAVNIQQKNLAVKSLVNTTLADKIVAKSSKHIISIGNAFGILPRGAGQR